MERENHLFTTQIIDPICTDMWCQR